MSNVVFNSNKDKVKALIQTKISEAIDKVGLNTEATIVEEFFRFPKPPIDSGDLMGSIRWDLLSPNRGLVTAGADLARGYAVYVEYGTYKMEARPYFRNGIKRAEKKNDKIIRDVLAEIEQMI